MNVALFSARVVTPRKKQKLIVWTLWVRACAPAQVLNSCDEWHPKEVEGRLGGAKAPSRRREKKRPFRRGARGGVRHVRSYNRTAVKGARLVRRSIPRTIAEPSEKASRRERGGGSRRAHFVSSFRKAAARLVKTSQQCLDIKRKGKEKGLRRLPPRAALGLARRQTSLRHACAYWGDAWASVHGESRLTGRRCWRELLHRLADVAHDEDVSSWKDTDSVIASEAAAEVEEQVPGGGRPRGPRRFPRFGEVTKSDLVPLSGPLLGSKPGPGWRSNAARAYD